jgi:hypothetical protein
MTRWACTMGRCPWRVSRFRSFLSGRRRRRFLDGALGSVLTIADDKRYSQPFLNALTVAAWLCPLSLDNVNVVGGQDKFVHYVEKAVAQSTDAEWALRFYNRQNKTRHSRLSFYTFNLGSPTGEGNCSYIEYGVSKNDETPIQLGQWVFVVGEAEPWISASDLSTGCAIWKQGVAAKRETPDKYGDFGVHPQHGPARSRSGGHKRPASEGQSRIWQSGTGRSWATKSPRSGAPARTTYALARCTTASSKLMAGGGAARLQAAAVGVPAAVHPRWKAFRPRPKCSILLKRRRCWWLSRPACL